MLATFLLSEPLEFLKLLALFRCFAQRPIGPGKLEMRNFVAAVELKRSLDLWQGFLGLMQVNQRAREPDARLFKFGLPLGRHGEKLARLLQPPLLTLNLPDFIGCSGV